VTSAAVPNRFSRNIKANEHVIYNPPSTRALLSTKHFEGAMTIPSFTAKRASKRPSRSDRSLKPQRAARLSPEARRAAILADAINYMAGTGLSWQTRDLAKSLKVTQSLIFRYFPTKQALIDAVFEEMYLKRWNPEWEAMLTDRSVPIENRLSRFYTSYTATIFDYRWIRIYLFSGLMGYDLNRRYVELLEGKVLSNICKEVRLARYPSQKATVTKRDMEVAWQVHAGVFYYGVRKFVYQIPVLQDTDVIVANTVRMLITQLPADEP
jgi:AcrR family transcriptional regulator